MLCLGLQCRLFRWRCWLCRWRCGAPRRRAGCFPRAARRRRCWCCSDCADLTTTPKLNCSNPAPLKKCASCSCASCSSLSCSRACGTGWCGELGSGRDARGARFVGRYHRDAEPEPEPARGWCRSETERCVEWLWCGECFAFATPSWHATLCCGCGGGWCDTVFEQAQRARASSRQAERAQSRAAEAAVAACAPTVPARRRSPAAAAMVWHQRYER